MDENLPPSVTKHESKLGPSQLKLYFDLELDNDSNQLKQMVYEIPTKFKNISLTKKEMDDIYNSLIERKNWVEKRLAEIQ
jgi:hypothetical protein